MEDISEARWRIVKKDFFMQNDAKVNCAAFHAPSNLLVVGFSNGLFGLYDLPEFNMIHLLRYVRFGIESYLTIANGLLVSPRATLML
jgi:periodic tryptophan protein 2